MESKSLKVIQVVAKIMKVLSTIAFVFCIIGAVGCVIGLIAVEAVGDMQVGGQYVWEVIAREAGMPVAVVNLSMIIGLITCAVAAVVLKLQVNYFKNELAAGTPFTFEGAKELRTVGIIGLVAGVAVSIVTGIIFGIASGLYKLDTDLIDIDLGSGISWGLIFIVLSYIFTYGAEIASANKEA